MVLSAAMRPEHKTAIRSQSAIVLALYRAHAARDHAATLATHLLYRVSRAAKASTYMSIRISRRPRINVCDGAITGIEAIPGGKGIRLS